MHKQAILELLSTSCDGHVLLSRKSQGRMMPRLETRHKMSTQAAQLVLVVETETMSMRT